MQRVALINLGCVRNLVDAQAILGTLASRGVSVVPLERAGTVIINTCGFIRDAKQESIDAILDVLDLKKRGRIQRVIVAGCLSQRYADELRQEFPEVDAFIGVPDLARDGVLAQTRLTPSYMAYVKICESCFNHCAFCIIPKIKGVFKSRSMESVLQEAADLDRQGIKELNIIGQDVSAYGLDLYQEKKLPALLEKLCAAAHQIRWIRLLYLFPSHITDRLLDVIAGESKICKYIDVPFQHVSDTILQPMNRKISAAQTRELVTRIRSRIPGVKIRSAFIVGLPGEGDKEFEELMAFLRWARLDRVGVFTYSPEEGTPAFAMPDQVPDEIKESRRHALMQLQQEISLENHEKMIGQELPVLIEEYDESQGLYVGRSAFDAPDVDGVTYVRSEANLAPGDFVKVRIEEAYEYDLLGELQRREKSEEGKGKRIV